jgi:hypothetical protein
MTIRARLRRSIAGSAQRVCARGPRTLAGWLVAVALAGAPALSAQQPVSASATTPAWLKARLDGRFDPSSRAAVERVIDSVHAAGLPAEPLVDKALEGASKRASPDQILRALRTMAAGLRNAREVLGASSLTDELTAGASALRSGVADDALRNLRQERPGQPLVVALGVLTDLVARGVPATEASRTVLALTRAGIADEQLVAFRREVERDIGIGAPPATAAALRRDSFSAALAGSGGATGSANRAPQGRPRP